MDKYTESKSFPVPKGRIRRASSFGKIAMRFASSILVGGTKELVGGRSPDLSLVSWLEVWTYHDIHIRTPHEKGARDADGARADCVREDI